jgi:tetratricopeptide (TPR) repeat protein
MAQVGALTVISRTSVLRYKNTKKSIPEIARELGVDAVIEGAVRRDGDRLRVTAQLIHATSDRHLWAHSYGWKQQELQSLPAEIAVDVAGALRIKLSPQEQAALVVRKPVDPAVYAAFLKGKHHLGKWTNEELWQAIRYFQQAVDLDPTYAPAWASMGEAYEVLGSFANRKDLSREDAIDKAKAALERAVELDPTIRAPHQSLARIKRGEGDWEGAAREFQRARELDPNWPGPVTYLTSTGRYDEAVAASRQEARTNPLDYSTQLVYGHTCFMAGRYDEAIAQLRKTIQMDPDIPLAHSQLAWNYMKKGIPAEAVAECETAQALLRRKEADGDASGCGWVYAAAGRHEQALKIAGKLALKEASRSKAAGAQGNKNAFMLAKIYDAVGDRERALAYLRKSQDSAMPLRDNRFFSDQIKADPRFQELARQQPGYPPATGALAEVRAKAKPLAQSRQR